MKLSIASGGKPLVSVRADGEYLRAAGILADYLGRITGASFTVEKPACTCCSAPSLLIRYGMQPSDGFSWYPEGESLVIEAADGQAAVYAVYDLLERLADVRYYTKDFERVPADPELTLDAEPYGFKPIIGYRELYYYDFEKDPFAEKHKMLASIPEEQKRTRGEFHRGWGFWCHSFSTLLPPSLFDSHPEYFGMVDGVRSRDNEPCLSNPEVYTIMRDNLARHIAENPAAKYWSVSQNDDDRYCRCPACAARDEAEGGPMGSILTFVNRIAGEFPDKTISTLAYWYSRKPPKTIRPAKNVHIMLCNIEANRGQPIETDPRNQGSKDELLAWARICGNVFLWDYCIQFANLVSPFPNLRVLGPNMRFFVENNVRALFSQCNREIGGEFSDLRGYVLAKLMWDPYCDERAVMEDFCRGYYGAAGDKVLEYIDLMHDAMEGAGGFAGIFSSPTEMTGSFLTRELFDRYCAIFDEAEELVKEDETLARHLRTARLPLYFAGIKNGFGSVEERAEMIRLFAEGARATGLKKVEEWRYTVDAFVTDALAALPGVPPVKGGY